MKLERITTDSCQERVLLLFDPDEQSARDRVRSYLTSNDISPRREYTETRDDTEYEVYYFGSCYIEGHLDNLTEVASGA